MARWYCCLFITYYFDFSQVSSVIVILHHFRQPEKIHYLKVKEVMNLRENNTLVHLRLGFPACSRRLNFYHLQNPSLHRQKLIRAGAQDRVRLIIILMDGEFLLFKKPQRKVEKLLLRQEFRFNGFSYNYSHIDKYLFMNLNETRLDF